MTHLQVFDPPMCCSTGVCGPQVDPELPRFAAEREVQLLKITPCCIPGPDGAVQQC